MKGIVTYIPEFSYKAVIRSKKKVMRLLYDCGVAHDKLTLQLREAKKRIKQLEAELAHVYAERRSGNKEHGVGFVVSGGAT